jgi:hypothetical protein
MSRNGEWFYVFYGIREHQNVSFTNGNTRDINRAPELLRYAHIFQIFALG